MSEKKVTQSWEEKAVELSGGKSPLETAKDAREIYTLDLKTEISAIKSAISKAEMQERKATKEYEDSAFSVFQGDDAFKSYIDNRDNLTNNLKRVEDNLKFLQDSLTYREEQLLDLVGTFK
jgi:predicted  nucleic acid-binding Zn-ribbon protein